MAILFTTKSVEMLYTLNIIYLSELFYYKLHFDFIFWIPSNTIPIIIF